MKTELVSIIMPAYNGEKFIAQAIKSVLDQYYLNWELLVIDDGSTDGTAKKVNEFSDSRIHYVYQENQGQTATLNYGLELAAGEYVTTLDVDDWYTPNSLQDRVEFLEQNPDFDVVYGDGYYCDVDGMVLREFSQNLPAPAIGDVYNILINNSFFGTGANVMVRKSVFEKYQLSYDTAIKYCQDFDLYVRMAEHVSFGAIKSHTVWYRIHEDNMYFSMSRAEKNIYRYRVIQKILRSKRFVGVPTHQKISFYSGLLIYALYGREEEQLKIISSKKFRDLPPHEQGRLIRLAANKYIIEGDKNNFSKQLISIALKVNARDLKSYFVRILLWFGPSFAKSVLLRRKAYAQANISEKVARLEY